MFVSPCQQRYRRHLEKNPTHMPAISWRLTLSRRILTMFSMSSRIVCSVCAPATERDHLGKSSAIAGARGQKAGARVRGGRAVLAAACEHVATRSVGQHVGAGVGGAHRPRRGARLGHLLHVVGASGNLLAPAAEDRCAPAKSSLPRDLKTRRERLRLREMSTSGVVGWPSRTVSTKPSAAVAKVRLESEARLCVLIPSLRPMQHTIDHLPAEKVGRMQLGHASAYLSEMQSAGSSRMTLATAWSKWHCPPKPKL